MVEFKLASNPQLRHGFEKQIPIYEAANDTKRTVKIIICYNEEEINLVNSILNDLGIAGRKDIFVIDARGNKPSASVAP